MNLKSILICTLSAVSLQMMAKSIEATLLLKQPGNPSRQYTLTQQGNQLIAPSQLPLTIAINEQQEGEDKVISIRIHATKQVYFNLGAMLPTNLKSDNCEFYLPGFWYHRNLRSPKEAPSFHTSKSWNFRDDRLSTPLTSVYDAQLHKGISVLRINNTSTECSPQLTEGEVILPGNTSVGFLGFDNETNEVKLCFGFPYIESPKRYIRKLTLAPSITTFQKLEAGEERVLTWRIHQTEAENYGMFVSKMWQYSFDKMRPQPITPLYSADEMKGQLTNYFRSSFVNKFPLKYNSGITLETENCNPYTEVQLGFCGRVLLNAFNEIEYGESHHQTDLFNMGQDIIKSWLQNGFTPQGWFIDWVNYSEGMPKEFVHSIRQQSEGIYAILHYLNYEKKHGRQHPEWEKRTRQLLNNLIALQKADGHFARKYNDAGEDIDASGGSTPSATSTLVMGYKYFKDKKYLLAAKRTIDYVEKNIISKSDYFSSTLDANCEDKEAAIAAVTSTYYLAMVTTGKERQHYIDLCKQAAYFALSWYYTWDVPFAQGQMLGDLGFKSRGWSNVSVENNHIDVFVFELPHIIKWLSSVTEEKRFEKMYDVIYSSLNQLLPTKERLCGIGKPGFYPEVVQHTTWDYGRNGKGFYNNLFAPGWTIASLWELYSPNRTVEFLK
ncbi:hypothetical protein [Hoylesella nanceiensis]|uniref:hypothetical protein n=1 Tax=Hoylesella nanceiensis TaxID=425941 RepID=UPI001CB17911|nr:hypothetical protein [Hoylesella nanceiensis]MBF1421051.1 hypothetical protein [Hoylesella nanceiensis]MBF1454056.1 hypothetical protein [Hoylesella nanceiensis]